MDKFEFFKTGSVQSSYGGQYSYKVIGPCCRLYDREELPWPCSRLAWRSKGPSWRRIGSRFVADMASRNCPSYSVQILEPGSKPVETVIISLPPSMKVAFFCKWINLNFSRLAAFNQVMEVSTVIG